MQTVSVVTLHVLSSVPGIYRSYCFIDKPDKEKSVIFSRAVAEKMLMNTDDEKK